MILNVNPVRSELERQKKRVFAMWLGLCIDDGHIYHHPPEFVIAYLYLLKDCMYHRCMFSQSNRWVLPLLYFPRYHVTASVQDNIKSKSTMKTTGRFSQMIEVVVTGSSKHQSLLIRKTQKLIRKTQKLIRKSTLANKVWVLRIR